MLNCVLPQAPLQAKQLQASVCLPGAAVAGLTWSELTFMSWDQNAPSNEDVGPARFS